jgi:hypothetical protein
MSDCVVIESAEDSTIILSADDTFVLEDSTSEESLVTGEISTVDLVVSDPGVAGPPNSLSIGTVTVGETPAASITGVPPTQVLSLVLPYYTRHVHTQATPSTTWTINHSLGGYPSVSVVDSARTVVFGEVTYQSTTQVVVNFSTAFSGYAYLT